MNSNTRYGSIFTTKTNTQKLAHMSTHTIVPQIIELAPKTLVGMHLSMSLAENKTAELWNQFMPLRNAIPHRVDEYLISMQVYAPGHFQKFSPLNTFVKWAAVEVLNVEHLVAGTEHFALDGGLYAVFHYVGLPTDTSVFQYIFSEWLPQSGFELEERPHFEVLGKKYSNNSSHSEEEIWIPIRNKK